MMRTFDAASTTPASLLSSPTTSNPTKVSGINRGSTFRGSIKVVPPPTLPNDANADPRDVIRSRQQIASFPVAQRNQMSEDGRMLSFGGGVVAAAGPMQLIPEQSTVLMFNTTNNNNHHQLQPQTSNEEAIDYDRSSPSSLMLAGGEQLNYRYSSSSLDSGRGSDSLKLTATPSSSSTTSSAVVSGGNRISVHSVESIGSVSSAKDSEVSHQSSLSSSSSSTSSSFCSSSSSSSSLSYQQQQHPHYNRALVSGISLPSANADNIGQTSKTTTTPVKSKKSFLKKKKTTTAAVIDSKTSKSSSLAVKGSSEPKMENSIPSIPEMLLYGISDPEIIHNWLAKIGMSKYESNFIDAAYDMGTISRMNPQDLTAIGITDPNARSALTAHIQKLNIDDGLPTFKPETLEEWLGLLNLSCYHETLSKQNFDTVDKVTQLTWEDLEDFGISKLGHQKKLLLAIRRIKSLAKAADGGEPIYGVSSSPYTAKPLESPSAARPNMLATHPVNTPDRPNSSYQLSFQDVPIKINTLNSPTTGEMRIIEPVVAPIIVHNNNLMHNRTFVEPRALPLSTFQQQMHHQTPYHPRLVPNTAYYRPVIHNGQQHVMQYNNLRGRSMENLTTTDMNYYNQFYAPATAPIDANGGGLQYSQPYYQYSNGDLYSLANRPMMQPSFAPMNTFNNNQQHYAPQPPPQFHSYEVDGTNTLNRPKSFAKPKPVARIINEANNFDAASIKSNDSASTLSTISNDRNGLASDSGSETSSLYGGTKKNPPPPPKRANSVVGRSSSSSVPSTPLHQPSKMFAGEPFFNAYDDIGVFNSYTASEDLFATCVKSLTNKFSEMHALSPQSDQPKSATIENTATTNTTTSAGQRVEQNYKTLPLNKKEKSLAGIEGINASSSSSTESVPFANDNIGTIRQKNSLIMQNAMKMFDTGSKGSASSSSSSSSTTSPMFNPNKSMANSVGVVGLDAQSFPPPPPLQQQQTKEEENSKQRQNVVDSLEDIELMLANLKTQLDSIE